MYNNMMFSLYLVYLFALDDASYFRLSVLPQALGDELSQWPAQAWKYDWVNTEAKAKEN